MWSQTHQGGLVCLPRLHSITRAGSGRGERVQGRREGHLVAPLPFQALVRRIWLSDTARQLSPPPPSPPRPRRRASLTRGALVPTEGVPHRVDQGPEAQAHGQTWEERSGQGRALRFSGQQPSRDCPAGSLAAGGGGRDPQSRAQGELGGSAPLPFPGPSSRPPRLGLRASSGAAPPVAVPRAAAPPPRKPEAGRREGRRRPPRGRPGGAGGPPHPGRPHGSPGTPGRRKQQPRRNPAARPRSRAGGRVPGRDAPAGLLPPAKARPPPPPAHLRKRPAARRA